MNVGVGTLVTWTRDDNSRVQGKVIEIFLMDNSNFVTVPFVRIMTEDEKIFGIYADPASLKRHDFAELKET